MTFNGDCYGAEQYRLVSQSCLLGVGSKEPVADAMLAAIPRLHPMKTLLWVKALGPLPQQLPYVVVNVPERCLGHHMPVIHGPTLDDRVERHDHCDWVTALFFRSTSRTFVMRNVMLLRAGLIRSLALHLRTFCPRKSNPFAMWVTRARRGISPQRV